MTVAESLGLTLPPTPAPSWRLEYTPPAVPEVDERPLPRLSAALCAAGCALCQPAGDVVAEVLEHRAWLDRKAAA